MHREAQFSVWSEETLQSYLDDLFKAKDQGHDLMTLKYARMENLIPPLNVNPKKGMIVQMELEAQREMLSRYPNILGQGRPLEDNGPGATSFKTYLRGELETYSNRTLELLYKISSRSRTGQNLVQQLYTNLVRNLGYHSTDELEDALCKKNAGPPGQSNNCMLSGWMG